MEGKYLTHIDTFCREHMQANGFNSTFEINIDDMLDKTFHTYRRAKLHNEGTYTKWWGINMVNKHFTRRGDQLMDLMHE